YYKPTGLNSTFGGSAKIFTQRWGCCDVFRTTVMHIRLSQPCREQYDGIIGSFPIFYRMTAARKLDQRLPGKGRLPRVCWASA
ncbi:hypothetical protein PE067_00005, partial [Paracoccus sp. DMF-8]|uniref:hypothetical protein n=1 Tax=Paracoccus sp. DMF-8 TaxID=3019445 RepID=UPI0023E8D98C